jgi:hypothetical protein
MNHKQEIKYTVLLSKINNDIQEKLDIQNIQKKLDIPNIQEKLDIPNVQEKLDIDIIKQICYFYYYEGDYLTIYNFLLNKNTVEKNNIILDTTFKLKNKFPIYNIDTQQVLTNKKNIKLYYYIIKKHLKNGERNNNVHVT